MNPQDYYFTLTPCNNGWLIRQYEWVKNERFDVTHTMVYDSLPKAIEELEDMAREPVSFVKAYE